MFYNTSLNKCIISVFRPRLRDSVYSNLIFILIWTLCPCFVLTLLFAFHFQIILSNFIFKTLWYSLHIKLMVVVNIHVSREGGPGFGCQLSWQLLSLSFFSSFPPLSLSFFVQIVGTGHGHFQNPFESSSYLCSWKLIVI